MTFRSLGAAALAVAASSAIAAPTFLTTDWSSPGAVAGWQVATNLPPGADATNFDQFQQLLTSLDNGSASWAPAVACSASPNPPPAGRSNWIANTASCSNGAGFNIGGNNWTQFIFRQQFELTAAEAATLQLSFQWAADDSGEIGATRGSWRPTWSVNSVDPITFQSTPWPSGIGGIPTSYNLSPTVTASGFQAGMNTMYFWVQGNGRTDGMRLANAQFSPVPEPGTAMLAGLGLLALGLARRRSAAGR
ncbi:MAG: PEP-CTERM sorting domain-containing protein [Burkholderiales bacterium]|nr:PEP-CTERM sorting domain-containing protein [Burkholderiales bacterium]